MTLRIAIFFAAATGPGWSSYKVGGTPEAVGTSHALSILSTGLKRKGHAPYLVDIRSFASLDSFDKISKALDYEAAFVWVAPLDEALGRHVVAHTKKTHPDQLHVLMGPGFSSQTWNGPWDGADVHLIGEPDHAIYGILDGTNREKIVAPPQIANLDDLPDHDHGLFNIEIEKQTPFLPSFPAPNYTYTVGRRCPYCYDADFMLGWIGCAKCRKEAIKPRIVTPQRFVDILYRLSGSHGTGGIGSIFVHDTNLASSAWLEIMASDWADMIPPTPIYLSMDTRVILSNIDLLPRLQKIGLRWVGINLWSGSKRFRSLVDWPTSAQDDLQAVAQIKRNRLNTFVRATVGFQGETDGDLAETEALIRQASPQKLQIDVLSPVSGHPLHDAVLATGKLSVGPPARPFIPHTRIATVNYDRLETRVRAWQGLVTPVTIIPVEGRRVVALPSSSLAPLNKPFVLDPSPGVQASSPETPQSGVRTQIDRLYLGGPEKPKVTVIICSYNRPDMIREAFHSIEEQTFPDWEVIFVDDASSDPGVHEFLDYKEKVFPKKDRVRIIRHKQNVNNIAVSWNEALEIAHGEYVAFLDDDNRKHSNFLERLVAELDAHPEVDGVHCRSRVINKTGHDVGGRDRRGNFTLDQELDGNFVDSGELLVRREVFDRLGPFDERCKACEDWDMICRITAWGKGLRFVDETLTDYRAHGQNRIQTSVALGAQACTGLLRSKHSARKPFVKAVRLVTPPEAKLTASQKQVIGSVREALAKIPWIELRPAGDDLSGHLVIIAAPFIMEGHQIEETFRRAENSGKPVVATLHMEDPQAIHGNFRCVGRADWVIANDIAAMRWYVERLRAIGELQKSKQVLGWNSLGVSQKALAIVEASEKELPVRDIDVLALGYPYPTRAQLLRDFLKDAPTNWKIVAVGDGWEKHLLGFSDRVACLPTSGEDTTMHLLLRAKVTLLSHRTKTDIGGFPVVQPESFHRGFMEAAAGCEVLVKNDRFFGEGWLRFHKFDDAKQAVALAWGILAGKAPVFAPQNRAHAKRHCSFEARLSRLLHCIFAERYNVVIP